MPQLNETENFVGTALRDAGRLPSGKPFLLAPLPGNPGRKDYATLQRFVVSVSGSPIALLTVGKGLSALKERSLLFASAYPDLACPVFAARVSADGPDMLLANYFDGMSAVQALSSTEIGVDGVLAALQKLAARFNAALRPSSCDAATAELRQLCERVLQMEYWSAADRGFLTSVVFPFAEKRIVGANPTCRATNGDLTLSNILLGADGEVRIIDYEQAALTHFHFEDWLRVTYWNAPQAVRDFAYSQLPDLPAAQLYLWLKQLVFEAEVNTAQKAQDDIKHWAGEIRNFIERQIPEMQKSLIWPAPGPNHTAQLLKLYHQALEPYDYARRESIRSQQLEDKLSRIQASFSWRSTAWLRSLRRTLIDPYVSRKPNLPAAPQPLSFKIADLATPLVSKLHYHLDTGLDQIPLGASTWFTGWVFTSEPVVFCKIRARIGNRIYEGEYGLERPEIPEKFFPQAYSRFRIKVEIKATDARFDLEAGSDRDEWFLFFSKPLVRRYAAWKNGTQEASTLYAQWTELYDSPTSDQLKTLSRRLAKRSQQPLISLLLPVCNTAERWLVRAIESVRDQVYPHWELCIADDASTEPHVRSVLERFEKLDPRIKLVFRTTRGGSSAASNSALELATGDYAALFDHNDELPPHALGYFAELIGSRPDAEIIYSDEDKITEDGVRFAPHFKPDWNPDLLNSQNYLGHLTVYRTNTLRSVGGLRVGYEGNQDWDLALRVAERATPQQIHHIPRILYHWRAFEDTIAKEVDATDSTQVAARKALEDHFSRIQQTVSVEQMSGKHWRIRYPLPSPPPLVTLVIPTRNRRELLVKCVETIVEKTRYPNYEFLIADNESDDPLLKAFYAKMEARGRFAVLSCPGAFNYSAINNRAVQHARGEIIGLLNNDLEAISPGWLDEMVGHALRPEIGVVGAKLYYPDMRIQHAGVITGLGGVAGHPFSGFLREDPCTPQERPHVTQNLTAVTAACAVLRKSVFLQAGGFDEKNLKVAFNDVDFCLRVQSLGYRNLFTPFAEFIHHESASRGADDSPEKIARYSAEIEYMKHKWGDRLVKDPAYNPNLTLDYEDFSYAFPPRVSSVDEE